MKAFFHQKVVYKKYICRTLCLHLKKLTPIKRDCINKPCPVMRHAILFLQHIFWYCSAVLLLSVCLQLNDDKFRENNAIICPASYSYYRVFKIIHHLSDKNNPPLHRCDWYCKINVMHMLRFRSTDPCTKTRRACVDRSSKTAFNFSKHHVKLFCKPPK